MAYPPLHCTFALEEIKFADCFSLFKDMHNSLNCKGRNLDISEKQEFETKLYVILSQRNSVAKHDGRKLNSCNLVNVTGENANLEKDAVNDYSESQTVNKNEESVQKKYIKCEDTNNDQNKGKGNSLITLTLNENDDYKLNDSASNSILDTCKHTAKNTRKKAPNITKNQ